MSTSLQGKYDFSVIFDMDGVIVDNHVYHDRAWKLFAGNHNKILETDDFYRHFGGTNKEILSDMFGPGLSDDEIKSLAREKEEIYRRIYRKEIKAVTGLERLLISLKKNYITTAIATSAPLLNVEFVLKETSLSAYFNTVVHDSIISRSKPHPEIYLKTAQALNRDPEKCIAIEDTMKGIESARSAGMKVIGIATTYPVHKLKLADMCIKNFNELDPDKLSSIINM
jgi:beta-phosphoglucomutase